MQYENSKLWWTICTNCSGLSEILGELSEKLKNFSYRVLKDDCLDLPKKHL